jgi:hypothetical protein
VITLARVESELDYWFSGEPPECSVLWLIGSPESLFSALAELAASLHPRPMCAAAACSSKTRPLPFATASSSERLLQANLEFAGSALGNNSSSIIRHPSSRGSVGEVVSVDPSHSSEIWRLLATANGLRICGALFPAAVPVPDDWIYSALRLVMIAGTSVLNRGVASGARDALLHAFLADTLQADGIAAIKGGLELWVPEWLSPAAWMLLTRRSTYSQPVPRLPTSRSLTLSS